MRRVASETLSVYENKHNIHALVEFDVTKPRKMIKEYKEKTGEKISFTGFIVNCVAQAVEENKITHAMRYRRKKLVIFDDVDVCTLIERIVDGEIWPTYHIIRGANKKSLNKIHEEIRTAQVKDVYINNTKKLMKKFLKVPKFLRMPIRKIVQKNPFIIRKNMGTIVVTSIGMFGMGSGYGIPYVGQTLSVTVGGISRKPVFGDNDEIIAREFLNVTISLDHDIIDGAPSGSFHCSIQRIS